MRGWAAAAAVLLVVIGCNAGADDVSAIKIQWVPDLNEGLRLAKENGKPVMLYFTADWCGPCQALKKGAFSDKRVAEASRKLVNIQIDHDKNPESFSAYRINAIPAILFLAPSGELISRYRGDFSSGDFVKSMKSTADKHTK
jgi:thiol:disulfide interchange protein